MKKTFVIALLIGFLGGCGSQKTSGAIQPITNFTKNDLRKIADWKYGYDLDKAKFCDLLIIDGTPYEGARIDSILNQYDKSDIGMILMVEPNNDQIWFNRDCDILTLMRTKPQSNQEKKKILEQAKSLLNERVLEIRITDYQCAECPMMTLNDTLILNPYERKKIINKIKLTDIEYIANITQPLNTKTYGKTGKNGIIEITTK